MPEGSGAIR